MYHINNLSDIDTFVKSWNLEHLTTADILKLDYDKKY